MELPAHSLAFEAVARMAVSINYNPTRFIQHGLCDGRLPPKLRTGPRVIPQVQDQLITFRTFGLSPFKVDASNRASLLYGVS